VKNNIHLLKENKDEIRAWLEEWTGP